MKRRWKVIIVVSGMLLMPLGVTIIFSGYSKIGSGMKMDTRLAEIILQEIPEDYPMEALKAQAILARSTVEWEKENHKKESFYIKAEKGTKRPRAKVSYREVKKAVRQTNGMTLKYQGNVCPGIFHRISAGHTRNGADVLPDLSYEYITGVESVLDQEAQNYLTGHYFTPAFLWKKFQNAGITVDNKNVGDIVVKQRDEAGYVQMVMVGENRCTGEEIRELLKLPSSSFTVEYCGDQIRFLCRGQGHGLGMSQYGAARMAKLGSDCDEILRHYFPNVEISKGNE